MPRRTLILRTLAALVAGASPAAALEGRLLLPDGRPAAKHEVAVVGRAGAVRTDAEGHFRLLPDPVPPFTLMVTSPDGEFYAPLEVSEPGARLEATLVPAFRESLTVASGVAPGLEAPPAAGTVVLGREDLEQRRPQHVADALSGVAGASISGEGPDAVPVLRGMARGRTLVLIDGGRVTTERRAGPSATFYDPFAAGTVEVARGPGSVAYGSDAFGGVIDVRAPDPDTDRRTLRYDAATWRGGRRENAAGVQASTPLGDGAILGQVHGRQAEDGEAGGGERLANSSFRDRGAGLRYLTDTPAGLLRLGLGWNLVHDLGKPAIDVDAVRSHYPEESSRRFHLHLAAPPRWGFDSLDLQGFLSRYRLLLHRDRLATAETTRLLESSDVEASDASLRATAARRAGGGLLRLGVESAGRFDLRAVAGQVSFDAGGAEAGRTRVVSIADGSRWDHGLFATFERGVAERLLLSAGLRGDSVRSENRGGVFGDLSVRHRALSGHAAVTAGPFAHTTATLQMARGFRDPTLSDRFFVGPSGRGTIHGNPDLEPERSLQWDGSVRWGRGAASAALFGYSYRVRDLIERFRVERDFFFRNRGAAEIQGLELEARLPLAASWSLESGLAWARGEDTTTGEPLMDIAAPGGWLTARWAGRRAFAYGRVAAFTEDDRPGGTEVPRPGHTTYEAGAGWRLNDALELRVIGRNLGDRRYFAAADELDALAPGRALSLGVAGRM
jgi:outer membrane receptor protein involved in Fe transport